MMKKGIVIALAIAVVFLFVGCGDKPNGDNDKIVKESLEQQLMGPTWYQTTETVTEIGSGTIYDDIDGYPYPVNKITLTIKSTVNYKFNQNLFTGTYDIIQKKSGNSSGYRDVEETSKETKEISGVWYVEEGKLFMIEDDSPTGTSYNIYFFNDELILENEYAGTFIRLKKK